MSQIHVTHVITGLGVGGAELMAQRVIAASDRSRFSHDVVSLTSLGPVAGLIEALGVEVTALAMGGGPADLAAPFRLARHLKERRPDLVQTWMYHADLVGGLAARLAGKVPVVWGITASNLDEGQSRRTTFLARALCTKFSASWPRAIISCAEVAKEVHVGLGYPKEKITVIPNGVDMARFWPHPDARRLLREAHNIPDTSFIVGTVGRWDPQKDYRNFVAAAELLCRDRTDLDVRFVLCGHRLDAANEVLAGWLRDAGIADRFSLLGRTDAVSKLMPGFDIMTLPSAYGEACPVVVLEAMSCGLPCAVTEVGDSALLIGDTGRATAPRDPAALANAWSELVDLGPEGRAELGQRARERVRRYYQIADVAARYGALYEDNAEQ